MANVPEATIIPLATTTQFNASAYKDVTRDASAGYIDQVMMRATDSIESACDRRLAPFSGITETHRLYGVDPDEYPGGDMAVMPVDIYASLGASRAAALGVSSGSLVRQFWLEQYAPMRNELWTYSITALRLHRTYGDTQTIDPAGIEGPWPDTGACRLRLGTWSPVGTTLEVVYSGGYTTGIPNALVEACIKAAAKSFLLELEPDQHQHDLDVLDSEIGGLIAPYMR